MSQEMLWTIIATVVAVILLRLAVALVLAGGDLARIGLTVRAGLRMLRDPDFADQVAALVQPPPNGDAPAKPSGEPLRLISLLQREGRLLDFLLEDIQGYANEQIGAAVRDIHHQCHKALNEHVVLEPVHAEPEGSSVEVPTGFDPSAIRLTGNVTGAPPFRGILRHHGWRVKQLKLSPPVQGQDELVVQPAEVEVV